MVIVFGALLALYVPNIVMLNGKIVQAGDTRSRYIIKYKKLFTPFFTTKKRGSGLGMAVSLKIVENHNGKIKIASKENIGTVVQVFFPVNK